MAPKKTKVQVLADLGLASFQSGENAKAQGFFEQALALADAEPGNPAHASVLMNFAVAKGVAGDMAAAVPLLERALAIRETEVAAESFGAEHWRTVLEPLQNLMVVHSKLGQPEKAAVYMQRAGELESKAKKAAASMTEALSAKITELEASGESRCVEVKE
ncbi:unnamed protein product [Polarella glacialis]|uniref:Tetratricopeptide repeat protein n=1 Tax=Polarella glacialis TaxID=89957 RepID=A0A813D3G5_POLGL|nr:unnamed protein product [Polarella glacialis]CAE8638745.1 unnamed protein product [Polarella glacialis]CAE8676010.1 unnamed protein product [Polarella glacialis]CAE8716938.1 unnamed protein product [Polarella glacialis]